MALCGQTPNIFGVGVIEPDAMSAITINCEPVALAPGLVESEPCRMSLFQSVPKELSASLRYGTYCAVFRSGNAAPGQVPGIHEAGGFMRVTSRRSKSITCGRCSRARNQKDSSRMPVGTEAVR